MTTSFTSGPIYVDPPVRAGDSAFGLLISLFKGAPSVTIDSIELFAAPNTGFNSPEDWIRILLIEPIVLEDDKMINLIEEMRCGYPYYQWIITYNTAVQVDGICHSLYLLDKNHQSLNNSPLITNGNWTQLPTP